MNRNLPGRPAVLLGRDGVITRRVAPGAVRSWSEFEFLPGAREGLRLFAEHGYQVLLFSVQRSLGAGQLSTSEFHTVTQRMLLEIALAGGDIAQVYGCTPAPEAACACGTLRVDVLRQALSEHGLVPEQTYFISDTTEDLEAAWLCGCPAIFLSRTSFLAGPEFRTELCEHVVSNLQEAAERILSKRVIRAEERAPAHTPSAAIGPVSLLNVDRLLMHLNVALGR